MTKTLAVSLAVATTLLSAVPVAEGHDTVAPNRCGVKGAITRVLTEDVRVVAIRQAASHEMRWWACMRVFSIDRPHVRKHGFKKRRFLGPDDCDPQDGCNTAIAVNDDVFRNPKVVFVWGSCSRYYPDMCGGVIRVVALRTGRRVSSEYPAGPGGLPAYQNVTATGTAVWMGSANGSEIVSGVTLDGESLQFDHGPDLSDMALVGNRLYWMRGDEPQTTEAP